MMMVAEDMGNKHGEIVSSSAFRPTCLIRTIKISTKPTFNVLDLIRANELSHSFWAQQLVIKRSFLSLIMEKKNFDFESSNCESHCRPPPEMSTSRDVSDDDKWILTLTLE